MNTNLNTEHEHEYEPKFQENHVFFYETRYVFYDNNLISAKILISVNSAEKTHVFRKGTSFLRILRKRHTFPKVECVFGETF